MKGLFVGLTTLDLIQYVESFPRPDEKLQADGSWIGAGGPAANAAIAFAALGGEAELLTALGPSAAARIARHDLEESLVAVHDLVPATGDLAMSSIVVDAAGHRTVVSVNGAGFPDLSNDAPPGGDADVVLADGHHVAVALPVLKRAGANGSPRILDGGSRKPRTDELLEQVEFAIVSSAFEPGSRPGETAASLLRDPVRLAAVSRGGKPIVGATAKGRFEIPVDGGEVVDTLGAGDVLHGAFAFHLGRGEDPEEALRLAAVVATESCAVRGPRLDRS